MVIHMRIAQIQKSLFSVAAIVTILLQSILVVSCGGDESTQTEHESMDRAVSAFSNNKSTTPEGEELPQMEHDSMNCF